MTNSVINFLTTPHHTTPHHTTPHHTTPHPTTPHHTTLHHTTPPHITPHHTTPNHTTPHHTTPHHTTPHQRIVGSKDSLMREEPVVGDDGNKKKTERGKGSCEGCYGDSFATTRSS